MRHRPPLNLRRICWAFGALALTACNACGTDEPWLGSGRTAAGAANAEEPNAEPDTTELFITATQNATDAQRAFESAHRFVQGWAVARDPDTGLYGERTRSAIWSPKNAAADLWPFMVLTTYYTDREAFFGDMRTTLESEIRLTSRLGPLPDYYSTETQQFVHSSPKLSRIIFGASEYAKDGLMPITEAIGRGPYFDRMVALIDGILDQAPFETSRGYIPSDDREVNGEMMQVLSRLYYATGNFPYLEMGERIASYYLLDDNLGGQLNLIDHASEVVSGLVEIYAALKRAGRDVEALRVSLKAFLDRILEVCRNENGLIYYRVILETGEVVSGGVPDTWGYVFNGIYTFGLVQEDSTYLDATVRALENINRYQDRDWGNADGYADTVESAIVLVNRIPTPGAFEFIESQLDIMLRRQRESGIIGGWWGDGNVARTALMYALMKTKGVHTDTWREDLKFGATVADETLYLVVAADEPWVGRLLFDVPRHQDYLHLPMNYPRLNEFPEWFTLKPGRRYAVSRVGSSEQTLSAEELRLGLVLSLQPGDLSQQLIVRPL